jgi:hypothetical protein
MRAGDLGRDLRQRGIAPAVVLEPVLDNDDGMGLSGPFAYQPRAGFKCDAGVEDLGALCIEFGNEAAQFAIRRGSEPAMSALLQPVGERPKPSDRETCSAAPLYDRVAAMQSSIHESVSFQGSRSPPPAESYQPPGLTR